MTVNARTEITPGETFIPVAPRLHGLTEYFVAARADNGASRIVPVYFFNETSNKDLAVVAFARGSWGNRCLRAVGLSREA